MPRLEVVLVETEFEDTIGLVARAMANFNIRDLRLVNPIAPVGRMARLRASHAQAVLDEVGTFESLGKALEDSDLSVGTTAQRARSIYRILRKPVTPGELARSVNRMEGTVALVFGREGTGLTNSELDQCEVTLTIPTSPVYPTLNISHAAAIIFHELYTAGSKTPGEVLAGQKVKDRMLDFVRETSQTLAVPRKEGMLIERAFKSMMGRSALRAREASLLTGFFRRVSTILNENVENRPIALTMREETH